MNRLKTLFYFLGVFILTHLGIRILVFFSNRIMDDIPDVIYVPTLGAGLGGFSVYLASRAALRITNNYERTRKILWIVLLVPYAMISILGVTQIGFMIYYGHPLFEFFENVSFSSNPNHWLYNLPYGLSGLYAINLIRKDELPLD
jgi:hypothetical protein